jgi:hypothetical protein
MFTKADQLARFKRKDANSFRDDYNKKKDAEAATSDLNKTLFDVADGRFHSTEEEVHFDLQEELENPIIAKTDVPKFDRSESSFIIKNICQQINIQLYR